MSAATRSLRPLYSSRGRLGLFTTDPAVSDDALLESAKPRILAAALISEPRYQKPRVANHRMGAVTLSEAKERRKGLLRCRVREWGGSRSCPPQCRARRASDVRVAHP